MYRNFTDSIKNSRGGVDYANGAIFIKRNVFDMLGGYMPWVCAADYELLLRAKSHVKIGRVSNLVLYRRIHSNALTKKSNTKMNSILRKKYHNIIVKQDYSQIKFIDKKMNKYFKID